jgi:hypothetical protein
MEPFNRTYVLSNTLYPPECIDRTIEEFHLLCEVQKKRHEHDIEVTLNLVEGAPPETPEEFLNFLLCASMEKLLA